MDATSAVAGVRLATDNEGFFLPATAPPRCHQGMQTRTPGISGRTGHATASIQRRALASKEATKSFLHKLLLAVAGACSCLAAQEKQRPAAAFDVEAVAKRVQAEFSGGADYPTTLPFAAMRDGGDHLQVQLAAGEPWLVWLAIDDVPTERIVAVSVKAFDESWWKRVTEDLPQVVALMGQTLGDQVRLQLRDPTSGKAFERRDVAMRGDYRQDVKRAGHQRVPKAGAEADPTTGPSKEVQDLATQVGAKFDPREPFPTTLPFVAMQPTQAGIEVQLDGDPSMYAWISIDGVPTERVIAVCRAAFDERWWKRITEDLPQVLALMGHPVGDTVALELRPADGGETLTRQDVPMTAANRRAVKSGSDAPVPAPRTPDRLPPEVAQADVQALRTLLDTRFSYARLRGTALTQALDDLTATVKQGALTPERFALAVHECITTAGDGHAGVRGWEGNVGGPWLPFLLEECDGRFVAVRPDRSDYFVPSHPFVVALDGKPVEQWLDIAARLVSKGSPQLVRRRALRTLRDVQALWMLDGKPRGTSMAATFATAAGERASRRLALVDRRPTYGTWPRPEPVPYKRLTNDLGYLRIAEMSDDPRLLDGIDAALLALRATRGLIVDVRGNGGGTRNALRRFLPYVLPAAQPARLVNVAAYRRGCVDEHAAERGEALSDRGLFPSDHRRWSDAARAVIADAARAFAPSWPPPADAFGAWHYAVVERRDNARAFAYPAPVAVLIDSDCFSATDIFVGALHGLPNVTLVGRPTGGGSGRAQTHTLPGSGVRVRLSTMASFRPDGTCYDEEGTEPDVSVEPAPADFVGRGDRVLDAAVAHLLRGAKK